LGGAWFEEALWEGAIARELWGALPEGASLHVASSMPIRDLDAFAPKRGPLRVLVSRGTNGIDGTLATAAGEALAAPDRAATVLLGDLAFLHDAGGLLAAPQLGANLRALVINNGGGGIFGFLPIAAHPSAFERFFLTPQDADLAALCAAAKAQHLRLTSIADLRAALQAPWRGVQVLELVVDRALNRALHQRAWAHVAASVRSALDLPTPASLP
jgi:2-succinyl-5-enolpyruvyl-6-hydroxy-3-cyclohexene-1-carboxylate synthase